MFQKLQVVVGGRDKLEQEILYEIFRPTASNHDQIMVMIQRLKHRAQLGVVASTEITGHTGAALINGVR